MYLPLWWIHIMEQYSALKKKEILSYGTTWMNPEDIILFFFFFFYLWMCWVFVSVRGLSLVVASGGHSSSRCTGLSLSRPLLLRSTGSRRTGSVIVAHGPSCSAACGIFPDRGTNPCPLHWQADSQPLRHQGSPWRHYSKWNKPITKGQVLHDSTYMRHLKKSNS